MLENIKLEIGIADTSQDAYLTMKIAEAYDDIDLYTNYNTQNIPTTTLETVVKKLVIERFNSRGLEGIGYHSEGGATYTFKEKSALNMLYSYRKPTLVAIRSGSNESV